MGLSSKVRPPAGSRRRSRSARSPSRRSCRDVPLLGGGVEGLHQEAHVHRVMGVPVGRHRAADADRVGIAGCVADVHGRPQFGRLRQRREGGPGECARHCHGRCQRCRKRPGGDQHRRNPPQRDHLVKIAPQGMVGRRWREVCYPLWRCGRQAQRRSWSCWPNALVVCRGLRSLVKEKLAPGPGGFGNMRASSEHLTNERSTVAMSGTPATRRKCRSRSAAKTETRYSSIEIVLLCSSLLGPLIVRPCFLVCSIARSIRSVFLNVEIDPPQRQYLAAPCSGVRGNRYNREQGRAFEAFH